MKASITSTKASYTYIKVSLDTFVEVTFIEAFVEAFVETLVEVSSVEAFISSISFM